MRKVTIVLGILALVMLTGAKCNSRENPEQITCSRWDGETMTPIDCESHEPCFKGPEDWPTSQQACPPVPTPAPEHSLQTGRQPAPSRTP